MVAKRVWMRFGVDQVLVWHRGAMSAFDVEQAREAAIEAWRETAMDDGECPRVAFMRLVVGQEPWWWGERG